MHHVVTQQKLREVARSRVKGLIGSWDRQLVRDERNLVGVAFDCHNNHHRGARDEHRLALSALPDECYEFAAEVLGAAAAYEYLRRNYRGEDPRLVRLLEELAA